MKRAKWQIISRSTNTEQWSLKFDAFDGLGSAPIAIAQVHYGIGSWAIPIFAKRGESLSISDAMAMAHVELLRAGFEHLVEPPPEVNDGA